MSPRERIVAKVRALLQKTVANGCTEAEAASAAEVAARLMAEHNISLDEAEVERETITRAGGRTGDRDIAPRIWRVGQAIGNLTTCRAFSMGDYVRFEFVGEEHNVVVAKYLYTIVWRALVDGRAIVRRKYGLKPAVLQRHIDSYLDGMVERLAERINDMVPQVDPGTGLVPLRFDLIDRKLKKDGISLRTTEHKGARRAHSYQDGRAHADRVHLGGGLTGTPKRGIIT